MGKIINEIGNTYHYLEVFVWGKRVYGAGQYWWCYCHNCGGFVEVRGDHLRRFSTKSCGCYRRERAVETHTGNQYNWNPNLTDEEREGGRFLPENRAWVRLVLERDNYTCQCCGERGGNLEAHHIHSWKDYPELRYDPDNGITMCWECHRKKGVGFHSIYGTQNTTKEQLVEYITITINKMSSVMDWMLAITRLDNSILYNGEII